jgi:hypothetical protein
MEDLKLEYSTATFPDWWKIGELTEADKKRSIITRTPRNFHTALKLHSIDGERQRSVEKIVHYYYTTLETIELMKENNNQPSRKGPKQGRGFDRRVNNFRNNNYRLIIRNLF